MRLHLTTVQDTELRTYLFGAPERVTFLFLHPVSGDTIPGADAHVGEVRLLDAETTCTVTGAASSSPSTCDRR
jgi:hypothetical protein